MKSICELCKEEHALCIICERPTTWHGFPEKFGPRGACTTKGNVDCYRTGYNLLLLMLAKHINCKNI